MSGLRTENNIPNRKIVSGAIVGVVATAITFAAQYFKIDVPGQEILKDNIEAVIGGVTAIIFIVQYLTRPGKGDGVKTDK